MVRRLIAIALFAGMLLSAATVIAQSKSSNEEKIKGFRAEFLMQMADVQKKIIDLAEAMPAEKYSWRPMEGVRSVSEVYVHIAGTNYLLPTFIGIKAPEGMERDAEKKITEKSKVIEFVKKSFEFIKEAVMKTPDADLNNPAKFFGQETTVRGVLFNAALHMHEHLGQSIAYARTNKVVPPWTAAEQAQQQNTDTKK